jgi:murein peptide amidase A
MSIIINQAHAGVASSARPRSLTDFLAPLDRRAARSASLVARPLGQFEQGGEVYTLRRYVFLGPAGGAATLKIGIVAGIHGDEPEGCRALTQFVELLEGCPDLALGYCLYLYPVSNPTGFEDNTRHSRNGKDLNREFWRGSNEPEVRMLEAELEAQRFDGLISLHSDNTSDGLYGFVRGATLTQHLLRPALDAAAELLPLNQHERIDGFHAQDGLIRECYDGVLTAPRRVRPKPFEITLETPGRAPGFVQQCAVVVALRTILTEYRKFIAYAANL